MGEEHATTTMTKVEAFPEAAGVSKKAELPAVRPEESKASMENSSSEKSGGGSVDRDALLAQVENEKTMSLIKAWEESEKTKGENKAKKKMSAILSWENSKKAALEAELKKIGPISEQNGCSEMLQQHLTKPSLLNYKIHQAEYAEKMKNKIAMLHEEAEEKRAMVEAKSGEELLKAAETAAKYRSSGHTPKKGIGCFSS